MKQNVKILVSHRVDQKNTVIKDNVFLPIRCGARTDERPESEKQNIIGDDTGDNISDQRYRLNEMTVLYWGWKNLDADYYGLCHYRRYFSFNTDVRFNRNKNQLVEEPILTDKACEKYKINENAVNELIEKNPQIDIFLPEIFDLSIINSDKHFTNRIRHEKVCGKRFADNAIDTLLDIIKVDSPEYYQDAIDYYNGKYAYFCDTFIMKKWVFDIYCPWVYKILFDVEEKLNYKELSLNQTRMAAYFSEDLFGIFCFHNLKKDRIKIKELQLVYFNNTKEYVSVKPFFEDHKTVIAISSSNEYVPYVGVLLNSIILNSNNSNKYDIVILQTSITEEYKDILKEMFENRSNFSLRFVDVSQEISGYKFDVGPYTINTFYRLLIPYLFDSYERAIYLDADIVLNTDISELYAIDMGNNIVGAVPDIRYTGWSNIEGHEIQEYTNKTLKIDLTKGKYFNAGVLIYNVEEFINRISKETILEVATERQWKFVDQDVLNVMCVGRVKYLPVRWNIMVSGDANTTESNAPMEMYNEYIKARKKPSAIHYAGNLMPVSHPETDMWWFYWKYARNTPFYEILLARVSYIHTDGSLIALGLVRHKSIFRRFIDLAFPIGTSRRNKLKKFIPVASLIRKKINNFI